MLPCDTVRFNKIGLFRLMYILMAIIELLQLMGSVLITLIIISVLSLTDIITQLGRQLTWT